MIAALFSSCNDELKLNAPYRELPSIYALLNPSEPRQFIRINKVFLGESDANVMAKVADSVNYPEGELQVTLTRYLNNKQVVASKSNAMTIVFNETVSTLDPGAFSQTQRLWYTDEQLFETGEYRLEVRNNRTGNVFRARATSIAPIKAAFPPLTPPYYPYDPNTSIQHYIDYSQQGGFVNFIPNEAKIYQLVVRTHFFDSLNEQPQNNKRFDYFDFNFGTREERSKVQKSGVSVIEMTFRKDDYFTAAGLELAKKNLSDNIRGRKLYKIEFIVHSSTQEYIDYLQYSAPSFAITQTTPIYSNFEDRAAIGIFTFRNTLSVDKQPASTMINEFARNPNTCNYRFYDAALNVGNCPQ